MQVGQVSNRHSTPISGLETRRPRSSFEQGGCFWSLPHPAQEDGSALRRPRRLAPDPFIPFRPGPAESTNKHSVQIKRPPLPSWGMLLGVYFKPVADGGVIPRIILESFLPGARLLAVAMFTSVRRTLRGGGVLVDAEERGQLPRAFTEGAPPLVVEVLNLKVRSHPSYSFIL